MVVGLCQLLWAAPLLLTAQERGRLEDGHLVEHLAVPQRVLDEVAARADVADDVLDLLLERNLVHRECASECDVSGTDGLVVVQLRTQTRVQSVHAERDVTDVLGAVLEDDAHGVALGDDVLHGRTDAKISAGLAGSLDEHRMQVGAVDHEVHAAVVLLVLATEIDLGQDLGGDGIAEDEILGQDTLGDHLVVDAE